METVKRFNTEEFLLEIPFPSRTTSYTPIPHSSVINKIREEADKNNLIVSSTNYSTARNGNVVVGNFNFYADDPRFEMRLMFKNSYDKTVSFGIASGCSVFVCSNGMVTGEFALKRKHTGDADYDVDDFIVNALKELNEYYQRVKRDALILETISLINSEVYNILGQLFIENEIINSMQLNIVKNELFNSKNFNLITSNEFTAWDLYNAVTESLKKSHPTTYISDHSNLHNIFKTLFV